METRGYGRDPGVRWVASLVGLLMAAVGPVGNALAHEGHEFRCHATDDGLVCHGGETTSTPVAPKPLPRSSPYYYVYERAIGPCPGPDETLFHVYTHLRTTGAVVQYRLLCIGPSDPAPTPPPPPPSETQVVEAIEPLLVLDTGISPPADGVGGISQLDTWFWCSNSGVVDVEVSLNGWRADAAVQPTNLTWTIVGPDGTIAVEAESCGTEPDPDGDGDGAAATWTPNLKGEYTITLTVEWGGSWTRRRGSASQTFTFDPVVTTMASITYPVVEIQTVGGPSSGD